MPVKFKPFKAPAKFVTPQQKKDGTDGSISDDGGKSSAQKKNDDVEVYEVMYSKHLH